jgi:hypothetical protein
MYTRLLKETAPVARTDEEKANYPEAAEVGEWLTEAADKLAKGRQPTDGLWERSKQTLRNMFAYGESLHDDEAGRWIRGAYSLSAREGLKTPSGGDPVDEYNREHRRMYGVRSKLVSLPSLVSDRGPWHTETSTDHQTSIACDPGRRASGAQGASLRTMTGAVFKPAELREIPIAVAKRRHRSPEQRDLLGILGAFALVVEANVQALSADLGISPSTIQRLLKEARLTATRFKDLEDRVARLEDRADVSDRRQFTFESDIRNQLAKRDALQLVADDDPRSLEDRFEAFLTTLR